VKYFQSYFYKVVLIAVSFTVRLLNELTHTDTGYESLSLRPSVGQLLYFVTDTSGRKLLRCFYTESCPINLVFSRTGQKQDATCIKLIPVYINLKKLSIQKVFNEIKCVQILTCCISQLNINDICKISLSIQHVSVF
jgi:hypothetical protein